MTLPLNPTKPHLSFRKYGAAIALVLMALLLMLAFNPLLQTEKTPFLLFFGALTLSAWHGGRGPGLLATLLSALCASYFFMEPRFTLMMGWERALKIALFVLQSGLICHLVGSLRTAQDRMKRTLRERDQAEAELRESEADFRAMFSISSVGKAQLDAQTRRFLRVNAAFCAITGYTEAELLSMTVDEVNHPDDRERDQEGYRRLLSGEVSDYRLEKRYRRKDGRTVWVLAAGNIIRDRSGRPLRVVAVVQDITERQQIAAAIAGSEERLSLAVNNAGMATWDVDLQAGKTIWSPNHFTLLGYEPHSNSEVTDNLWRDRVHPDDREAVFRAVEEAKQNRSLCQTEYRIIRADNAAVRWLSAYAKFIYDASGNAVRFVGIFFDVTDRKIADLEIQRLNRDLARRADDLQTILDVLPVGIAIAQDPACKVIYANRFGQTMAGVLPDTNISVTGDQAESLPFRLLRDGKTCSLEQLAMERAVTEKRPIQGIEIQMVRSDGVCLDWLVNAVPLFNESGAVRGCVAAQVDVTELKRIQADLKERQEFVQQVAEALPGVLYVHDVIEQRNVYINGRSLEILGYTPEQMQSMGSDVLPALIHPDDLPQMLAYQAAFANARPGEVLEIEHRIRRPDGECRWVSSRSLVFKRTPSGAAQQVLGVSFDITERKQAEQKLQETLTLLNAISDYSIDLVFAKDSAGRMLFANPVIAEIFGKDIDELIGNDEYYFIDDRAAVEAIRANDQRIMRSGVPEVIEEPILIDGTLRTFMSTKAPLRDSEGAIVGIVGIGHDITERKQAELEREELLQREQLLRQQAEAAESRLQDVLSSIREDFVLLDRSWKIAYLNEQAANTIGVPREEILGRTLWDLLPDLVGTEFYDRLHQTMRDRTPIEFEYYYPTWDAWFLNRLYPAPNGIVNLCTNITAAKRLEADRKGSEAALRQSEARLHSVAANLPQGAVFIVDRDLRYQLAEGKALKEAGVTSVDLVGKTLWEALGPDLAAFYEPSYHRALAGESFSMEHHSHGRYYSSHGVPLHNHRGEVDAVLAVSYDITDRKRAEEDLRQKNAILDVINQSAPTPIFVKNRQGQIIYANPATLEVLGKSAEAVIGFRDDEIYSSPEDAARVVENDQRIMETGQMEIVEESPDGIRTFLGMKVPYRNEAGEVVGLIGISNDITERVQLERDRERILQQEQAAREAAEQANRIKDEFLAVLSHELRSPLNPILGWTRLLQTGRLDPSRQREALVTIERNAKLQAQLIEDLLDVSRIMRGKLTLTTAPVDLAFVISSAIETVRLAAEAKQIEIRLEVTPGVGSVWGDAARLQQVVWNLLTNAVKFTPNGGRVAVRLESCEFSILSSELSDPTQPSKPKPQNFYAQLTVTDTGKGIAPPFLPHVFEYFRQEDGSTTRRFGGLGLGLAIVRQIVELHGGTVTADSLGEGQGATFTVRLPLMQGGAGESGNRGAGEPETGEPETEEPETEEDFAPPPSTPLTGLQILLVDDEDDTREYQAFVLRQGGASVIAVSSGSAALDMLEQFVPDVLVSDIGMAEMNGYTLMQQLRRREVSSVSIASRRGRIPAIALTAYAAEADQAQAIAAGFQRHLSKPVDPETLIKTILDVTARSANV